MYNMLQHFILGIKDYNCQPFSVGMYIHIQHINARTLQPDEHVNIFQVHEVKDLLLREGLEWEDGKSDIIIFLWSLS